MFKYFKKRPFWFGVLFNAVIWGFGTLYLSRGLSVPAALAAASKPLVLMLGIWALLWLIWGVLSDPKRAERYSKNRSGSPRSVYMDVMLSYSGQEKDEYPIVPVGMRNYGRELDSIPLQKGPLIKRFAIALFFLAVSVFWIIGAVIGAKVTFLPALPGLLLATICIAGMSYCIDAKDGRIVICENAIVVLHSKTDVSDKVYREDIKNFHWREQGHGSPQIECRIVLKNGKTVILPDAKYVDLQEKLKKYQNEWKIPSV